MAEEKWLHWRNMSDNTHLRAEMFQPGEEKVVTIKEVKREKVINGNGVVSEKPVVYFQENIIPMVLNVVNCRTIEKLYGTGNIYEWVGKKIQIFTTTTKVGKDSGVPCLRIRNFQPKTSEVEYKCAVCGKNITKQIHDASIAKYGKPYCSEECLKIDQNGSDLLK